MRNIIFSSTIAVLSLVVVSFPASAETTSVSVQIDDLDLTRAAGMNTLEGRLRAATQRVCGNAEIRRIRDTLDHQSCVRSTRASVAIEVARATDNRVMLALNEPRR